MVDHNNHDVTIQQEQGRFQIRKEIEKIVDKRNRMIGRCSREEYRIYSSDILLPIKIKDTPKKSDDNENSRVRKLANLIRKYNDAKQSLLNKLSLQVQYQEPINSSVNPVIKVIIDQTSSMDYQVMLHQVATIPSLKRVPTTVFSKTRSKLTSRLHLFHHKQVWKKLGLPNFCKEIVNGYKFHLLSITISWTKNQIVSQKKYKARYETMTSNNTRFKKVKNLHQQPIIRDGMNQRLIHGKTIYQESLPRRFSRSAKQRLILLRVEKFALPLESNEFGLSTAPHIFTMLLRVQQKKNLYPTSKRQWTYLSN
ncbi:hypothetical protein ACTFIW_003363 [Dictyostelium discoideum]